MLRATIFGLALAALTVPVLALGADAPKTASGGQRVFELRTYYTVPGRLDALNARFRDHTCRIFQKHGMELIGFWTPSDQKDKLVYLLAYPSREAAKTSWVAFHADPEWKKARADSEKDGQIVDHVESVFLDPTDYSAIK